MEIKKSHSPFNTFTNILSKLPNKYRIRFWVLVIFMILLAFIETVTLGTIAFFTSSLSDPETVLSSSYIKSLNNILYFYPLITPQRLIIFLSIAVVLMVLLKNLIRSFVTYAKGYFSAFTSSYLGGKLFKGFLCLPYEWYLSKNSADLIIALLWRGYFGSFLNFFLLFLSDLVVVIFILSTVLIVNPLISLLVFLTIIGCAIVIFSQSKSYLDRTAKEIKNNVQFINREVSKAIHGIMDVKIYGRESLFLKNYYKKAFATAKMQALQEFLSNLPEWLLEAVGFAMLTTTVCLMYFIMEFSIVKVTGIITILALTAWRIIPAVRRILSGITQIRLASPYVDTCLNYLKQIEEESVEIDLLTTQKARITFNKEIRFKNIFFIYSNTHQNTLQDISFTIPKNATIGIIGPSGAGKSTLANILSGLLSPNKGEIEIDGQKLSYVKFASWIKRIGYVQQSPYISDDSLSRNVALGIQDDKIDREKVLQCCKMAAMDDFLADLPKGIDTLIGERGVKLSGGQRQRVAIARALYINPEILIFDEATSSLDSKSENAILKTIYNLKGEYTLIIIAHRLSSVENCDFIIWLGKGKINKTGSPTEIIPLYHHMMQKNQVLNT